MTAGALVSVLRARGVELVANGDRVRFRPAIAVTPAEREALRANKAEILAILASGTDRPRSSRLSVWSPWPEALVGLGARRVIPFTPCALCPRCTWVAYGWAPLCLDCATAPTTLARVAYRQALRRVWALTAGDERADPGACSVALNELTRWLDEVGEPAATEFRRRWAEDWHRESGRCPACGKPGPLHLAGGDEVSGV